jgi:hypothetical protein
MLLVYPEKVLRQMLWAALLSLARDKVPLKVNLKKRSMLTQNPSSKESVYLPNNLVYVRGSKFLHVRCSKFANK